ncbi:PEP-CTERM sorting domain-containing protein [Rubritalea spongiae]|uniref:PEP-CTERM sorting domain-containing protein n=1 Tax=Rubritalea spongiae TaxID=430797 RepID=A0ABW5E4J7_9BACT
MKTILSLAVTSVIATATSKAATLALFEFTGGSLDATTQNHGTASAISFGGFWATDAVNGNLVKTLGSNAAHRDQTNANHFVSFNFTVSGLSAGEVLVIDNAFVDYVESPASGNSIRHCYFLDYGSATEDVIVNNADPASASGNFELQTYSPSYQSAGYSNGDTLTFIYSSRENIGGTMTADNFQLVGSVVAVPEPSSTALLGLGGLALIMRRRK